jgi:nucleoside-diphosphate-sugar epimerase
MKSAFQPIPVTRSNISELANLDCAHFVVAAVSAAKWLANLDPEKDKNAISDLLAQLNPNSGYSLTLISTIDVFPKGEEFNEETENQKMENDEGYGKNRAWLEIALQEKFPDLTIVRLPGLFGPGLKKNLLFDLTNNREIAKINPNSEFQFYNVLNLAKDLNIIWEKSIRIQNIATEPIAVKEVLSIFDAHGKGTLSEKRFAYRMKTLNSSSFDSSQKDYIESKESVLNQLQIWKSETI